MTTLYLSDEGLKAAEEITEEETESAFQMNWGQLLKI